MLRFPWKAAPFARRQVAAHVMRPAFVYFDLGNVLFAFDRGRAFRQMAAVSGATADAVESAVMGDGLQAALELGEIDWAGFHRAFSRRTGTTSDPGALARAASDMFTLKVETLPVVFALERIGVPTGILSNTCDVHWRQLLAGDYAVLGGTFAVAVLSHEERRSKPDPEIYAVAADRAGVPADRIFFTDDIPAHVDAARRAGWDAEVFESAAGLAAALGRRGLDLGL